MWGSLGIEWAGRGAGDDRDAILIGALQLEGDCQLPVGLAALLNYRFGLHGFPGLDAVDDFYV